MFLCSSSKNYTKIKKIIKGLKGLYKNMTLTAEMYHDIWQPDIRRGWTLEWIVRRPTEVRKTCTMRRSWAWIWVFFPSRNSVSPVLKVVNVNRAELQYQTLPQGCHYFGSKMITDVQSKKQLYGLDEFKRPEGHFDNQLQWYDQTHGEALPPPGASPTPKTDATLM